MPRIHFDKTASTERVSEPVYVSVPVAEGRLDDPTRLRVLDGDRPLPVQTRVLSNWHDGSIRWLLAVFQADLPGNASTYFAYDFEGSTEPTIDAPVSVQETRNGWRVDTGPVQATVLRDGFDLLHEVVLRGVTLIEPGASGGGFFYEQEDGRHWDLATGKVDSAEWVERGPLRACLTVKGEHGAESGAAGLKYRVSLEFHAGKPWVRVQYQAILADPRPEVSIGHWGLRLDAPDPLRVERRQVAFGHSRCSNAPGAIDRL